MPWPHVAMQKHAAPGRGRGRHVYLPAELDQQLVAASSSTGIPVSRILQQGARLRLDQIEASLRAEHKATAAKATPKPKRREKR